MSTSNTDSSTSISNPERDVLLSVEGHVATITFCNEARFNAMAYSMWLKLGDYLEQLHQRSDVRVLILRGVGEKAFVSGADISEFGEKRNDPEQVALYDHAVSRAQGALAEFPRPVIAAISGICYGGGLGLILACDLRFASHTAKFRMPAARLGLGYAYSGLKRMVNILGVAKASEVFFTANVYPAVEAHALGLVNSLHTDVFTHANTLAQQIAQNAPLTIAAAKLAMNTVMAGSDSQDVAKVDQAVKACFASKDYLEGRAAFAQKRDPVFKGE
jgi:enoyl-CoA hydratase/carnithine racemase